jgi:hypothetical protein
VHWIIALGLSSDGFTARDLPRLFEELFVPRLSSFLEGGRESEPSQDEVVLAPEEGGRVDKLGLVPSPKTRAIVNTELREGPVRWEELARLLGTIGGEDV